MTSTIYTRSSNIHYFLLKKKSSILYAVFRFVLEIEDVIWTATLIAENIKTTAALVRLGLFPITFSQNNYSIPIPLLLNGIDLADRRKNSK